MATNYTRRRVYLPQDIDGFMKQYTQDTGVPTSKMVNMAIRAKYKAEMEKLATWGPGVDLHVNEAPLQKPEGPLARPCFSIAKDVNRFIDAYTGKSEATITATVRAAMEYFYAEELAEYRAAH